MEEQKLVFFEEIGLLYRKKREEKKLTVEDIMQELKFSVETICAMENADINALPRAVYTKGFYRSYGQLLGIDQEVIDAFIKTVFVEDVQYLPKAKSLSKMQAEQRDITVSFDSEMEKNIRRSVIKRRIILIVILCCIIASISYCVWNPNTSGVSSGDISSDTHSITSNDATTEATQDITVSGAETNQKDAVSDTTSSQSSPTLDETVNTVATNVSGGVSESSHIASSNEVSVKNSTEGARATQRGTVSTSKNQDTQAHDVQTLSLLSTTIQSQRTMNDVKNVTFADSITKELQSLEKNTESSSTTVNNSTVVQENANVVKASGATEDVTERLRIIATERVWIATEYNGKKRDFFLEPNQEKIIKFQGVLSLKVGNLAAVTLQYKGKTMSALGEAGKVGTYTFNAE